MENLLSTQLACREVLEECYKYYVINPDVCVPAICEHGDFFDGDFFETCK